MLPTISSQRQFPPPSGAPVSCAHPLGKVEWAHGGTSLEVVAQFQRLGVVTMPRRVKSLAAKDRRISEAIRRLAEEFHAESGLLTVDSLETAFSILDVLVEYRDAKLRKVQDGFRQD